MCPNGNRTMSDNSNFLDEMGTNHGRPLFATLPRVAPPSQSVSVRALLVDRAPYAQRQEHVHDAVLR